MKKSKKILSSFLAFTLVATLFTGTVGISSNAETTTDPENSLRKIVTLDGYNSLDDLTRDWKSLKSDGTEASLPAVSLVDPETSDANGNSYGDYKFKIDQKDSLLTPAEGSAFNINWAENTVESVSYTFLPNAYFGAFGFNYGVYVKISDNAYYNIYSQVHSTTAQKAGDNYGGRMNQRNSGNTLPFMYPSAYYYSDAEKSNLITVKSDIQSAYEKDYIAAANEITITVNFNKIDGKYYIKNVTETSGDRVFSNVQNVFADCVDRTGIGGSTALENPGIYLPGTKNFFFTETDDLKYNYVYIKSASVTYTEPVSNATTEFDAAYDKIKDLTVDNVAGSNKEDINNCLKIYNSYSETIKGYVDSAKIAHINDLLAKLYEGEYASVKDGFNTNGLFRDDFSDSNLSGSAWKTDYFNTTNNTEDGTFLAWDGAIGDIFRPYTNWTTYYKATSEGTPDMGEIVVSDGKLTPKVNGLENKNVSDANMKNLFKTLALNMRSVADFDALPADIQRISGKFELKAGIYSFLFGKNENATNIPAFAGNVPTVGFNVIVAEDGTVTVKTASFVKITNVYNDQTQMAACVQENDAVKLNGSFSGNKSTVNLDSAAESFTLSIDFTKKSKDGYTDYFVPTIKISDGVNEISGTFFSNLGANEPNNLPTEINGFSFAFGGDGFTKGEPYSSSAWMDDIEIIGAAAPRVNGASIKKTNDADKQDIRFSINVASNKYLTDKGYVVKNYGVVVALYDALADKNAELTSSSVYLEAYNNAKPVTKIKETAELPTGEVFVNIGESAAGTERLGLRYVVRPFVTYTKEGTDLIVYATDNVVGENGTCVRSIYSTGKKIAKAIQGKAGFAAEENYAVGENSIPYATVSGIIDGTAIGNSKTVIANTNATYGQALLAFTAKHNSLLS